MQKSICHVLRHGHAINTQISRAGFVMSYYIFVCFLIEWFTRNIHEIAHYSVPPFWYNLLICHKGNIETTHPSQFDMLLRLRHSFSIESLSDI